MIRSCNSYSLILFLVLCAANVSLEQTDGVDNSFSKMVSVVLKKLDEIQESNSNNTQYLQTQLKDLNLEQNSLEESAHRLRLLSEEIKKSEISNAFFLEKLSDKVRKLQVTKNSGLLVYEASKTGSTYKLRLLLESDAPTNYTDAAGNRPIHVATKNSHLEALRILLINRAAIEDHGEFGYTPLHWASHKNCLECAKILLERGASVSSRDFWKETPLIKAAKRGYIDLVKLLLEYGADLKDQQEEGSTALHLASSEGKFQTVKFLIQHNADLTAKNNHGQTALDLALFHEHYDIGGFLRSILNKNG